MNIFVKFVHGLICIIEFEVGKGSILEGIGPFKRSLRVYKDLETLFSFVWL